MFQALFPVPGPRSDVTYTACRIKLKGVLFLSLKQIAVSDIDLGTTDIFTPFGGIGAQEQSEKLKKTDVQDVG